MSSKIKVDTIETVSGSGNVTVASGNALRVAGGDLVVASGNTALTGNLNASGTSTLQGNATVGGTLSVTGTTTLNADTTLSKSGAAQLKVITTDDNTFAQVLIQDVNAGYSWQVRSDNAQSTTDGAFLLNDQRGTFPIIIEENNPTNTFKLSNGYPLFSKRPMFTAHGASAVSVTGTGTHTYTSADVYNSTEYDPDGHFNPSNGRFTAPIAGRYFFMFTIGISFSSGYHYTYIRKNNADVAGVTRNIQQENDYDVQCIQTIINLAQNDFVTTARNNNNVSGAVVSPMFTGWLLG